MSRNWEAFIRKRVKCCACQGSLKNSKHINGICLDKLATWELPVWGNILLKDLHPEKRALAILCDECIDKKRNPKFAVEWDENYENVKYHPVESLQDLPPITEEEVERVLKNSQMSGSDQYEA
jgi:hypothetical protein